MERALPSQWHVRRRASDTTRLVACFPRRASARATSKAVMAPCYDRTSQRDIGFRLDGGEGVLDDIGEPAERSLANESSAPGQFDGADLGPRERAGQSSLSDRAPSRKWKTKQREAAGRCSEGNDSTRAVLPNPLHALHDAR